MPVPGAFAAPRIWDLGFGSFVGSTEGNPILLRLRLPDYTSRVEAEEEAEEEAEYEERERGCCFTAKLGVLDIASFFTPSTPYLLPSGSPKHYSAPPVSHGPLPRPLVNSSIAMAHVCQRALGTRGKLFFVAVAHETSAVLAV